MTGVNADCEIGLIGLSVMGQNLSLNIASKNFKIAVWNRTYAKTEETKKKAKEQNISSLYAFENFENFILSIKKPRTIIILVQAGNAVDALINTLLEKLEANDMIIDGGNEWYENTERRIKLCQQKNIHYLGMGVSGGEEGARYGPSLMPGGSKEGYERIQHILHKIAAQVDGDACVTYIGAGASGNYVKMVHNGIEYGDMQLIAEAYDILKRLCRLSNNQLQQTFLKWNEGELKSFLIEITANIFSTKDDLGSSNDLVDVIKDIAGAKGTGKWTVKEAAEKNIPCPTIAAAVDMRNISTKINLRKQTNALYKNYTHQSKLNANITIEDVCNALYCSKICSYAQGMMLINAASDENNWNLNLAEIAKIWKGGCIIRAVFLDRIKNAFERNGKLDSLLLDQQFASEILARIPSWRKVVQSAQESAIPTPALSASLAYFDSFNAEKLPLNLVQAQRDYFGAHTYSRTDREGIFHTQWI